MADADFTMMEALMELCQEKHIDHVKIRDGVEAELPHFDQRRYPDERNERPAGERYLHNQHLKAVIIDVHDANSTSPAKVTRVLIDPEKNYAGVIVPDDQLSLAIGKEGQNARLAARLTGWHDEDGLDGADADALACAEDLI